MTDSVFGSIITIIAFIITMIMVMAFFGPGHNMFLECSNFIYMSFNSCRLVLGL